MANTYDLVAIGAGPAGESATELAAFFGLAVAGVLAPTVLVELYVLAVAAAGLNWLRTLAAHGYRNTGGPMTFREQIEDSIGIAGHPLLTELLFPVGLRYHSLHHWFPALPYHSLGAAHERLMRSLPQDSPYRRTMRPSFVPFGSMIQSPPAPPQ